MACTAILDQITWNTPPKSVANAIVTHPAEPPLPFSARGKEIAGG